jgi:diguanylate cyclase (GGDEF)-like protein
MFPLLAGNEMKGALVISDTDITAMRIARITEFCLSLAAPLEVLRVHHQLEERARFAAAIQNFSEKINATDPGETYRAILRQSADMLQANRSSLLLLDVASNELLVKAAVGFSDAIAEGARVKLGEGISGSVFKDGRPLMVRNADSFGCGPAHAGRNYKTKSFISYPIMLGGRKVGVLNVTDKKDGGAFDDFHLSLLDTISPQMALALDRAEWQEKAAQFQLMSITDALTGLLNRRYLEERLTEELNRSRRNVTPMSFIMIDIDDFKRYNDRNGHQAGDVALELTAQCLKSVLRTEDVAARYGGEEFSILLPQTTIDEAGFIAERLRQKIKNTEYPFGRNQPLGAVTVSIGVSSFTKVLDSASAIVGAADRALYVAKSSGKNRVHLDEESCTAFTAIDAPGNTK